MKEYNHIERIRFKDFRMVMIHLQYLEDKYETDKHTDYVICTCKGEQSAKDTFEYVLNHLGRLPTKDKIN